jgi:transcriptional regulator with PAS, ATPase and Fis domain
MKRETYARLCGTSRVMQVLFEEIEHVADSDAKVLVSGESGVGKELVARAIHAGSPRKDKPFVAVNCAGLPETLLESELFGHVRGSFTGAYRDKPGKFELASGGTVFLDEVGEMTLRMQGLLLRFLETGELQKVGADGAAITVDVRVVTATNRDLGDLIADGRFREDLFFRLNVISLRVPPLRERREDLQELVAHFLQHLLPPGREAPQFAPAAMEVLAAYAWPGNVRELQNVIERVLVTCREPVIEVDALPFEIRTPSNALPRNERQGQENVADALFKRLVDNKESFWTVVYPRYMEREITREQLKQLISHGLQRTNGSYRIVTRLFNMPPEDYKKFLNFLRKHKALLPFKEFR